MGRVSNIEKWATRHGEDAHGCFAECHVGGVLFVWRWIPPGAFLMGSLKEDHGLEWWLTEHDSARHEVTLSHGYWLANTPTSQAQWMAVMGENPSHFQANGFLRPVECVSWHDAREFARRLNHIVESNSRCEAADFNARLPTEAQWEYACRAGTTTAFNDGSDCLMPDEEDRALSPLAWYAANSGYETHEVGLKRPNRSGLYDMHGNVWEWCLDQARSCPTNAAASIVDPVGPITSAPDAKPVLRGGSYVDDPCQCRADFRNFGPSTSGHPTSGFRLAAGHSAS